MQILPIGSNSCGATSLMIRFHENSFPKLPYIIPHMDWREKIIMVQNTTTTHDDDSNDATRVRLQIWDTCRGEHFISLKKAHWWKRMDGLILCYDICNVASFNCIAKWIRDYYDNKTQTVKNRQVLLLCGTKADRAAADRVVKMDTEKHSRTSLVFYFLRHRHFQVRI